MAVTKYSYTKAVDSDRLTNEISANTLITIAIDHIDTAGTALDVYMRAALSVDEQTELAAVVASHSGLPLPSTAQLVTTADQKDSDGAVLSRIKAAPTGWTYQMRSFEFTTASLNSLFNKDPSQTVLTDITLKLYDASGVEITDPANNGNAVKTVVDFEPLYDFYLMGGIGKIAALPASDVRMSVVAVPDIPAASGGSKIMIQNANFKFVGTTDKINADGRAAKYLLYSATYHTNKLRFSVNHGAGEQYSIAVFLEHYKA